jgi:HSP20 family protein
MAGSLINIEKEFDRMKKHMSQVFNDLSFDDNFNLSFKQPMSDVYETNSQVVCNFDIPGISKEDIELSVKDGFITLKAEKKSTVEEDDKNKKHHKVERNYTGYFRKFSLPHAVSEKTVKAKFEHGTLNVSVDKTDKAIESDNLVKIE